MSEQEHHENKKKLAPLSIRLEQLNRETGKLSENKDQKQIM